MSKLETYRATLRQRDDWDPYLLAESHLPGPRPGERQRLTPR